MGQRKAYERAAHLMCELFLRLRDVDRSADQHFPLTQAELAEAMGLTSVHLNRVMKRLRRSGLVELEQGRLTICDLCELQRIALFDGTYLHLGGTSWELQ